VPVRSARGDDDGTNQQRTVPSHAASILGAMEVPFEFRARFSADERARFDEQVERFVRSTRFVSDEGAVDETTKISIAALACRLTVNLPEDQYGRLELVNVAEELPDEDGDERLGVMRASTIQSVSFTRAALADAFRENDDGINVVYHELAHVLDAADGICDGIPFLLDPREKDTWRRVIGEALERLRAARDLNIPTAIYVYGARKESDLFATATEAFFERPQKLRNAHPELYELLAAFYRQRP
jgi:Mlc titration factor MtfA (ptsG expression regulator)